MVWIIKFQTWDFPVPVAPRTAIKGSLGVNSAMAALLTAREMRCSIRGWDLLICCGSEYSLVSKGDRDLVKQRLWSNYKRRTTNEAAKSIYFGGIPWEKGQGRTVKAEIQELNSWLPTATQQVRGLWSNNTNVKSGDHTRMKMKLQTWQAAYMA